MQNEFRLFILNKKNKGEEVEIKLKLNDRKIRGIRKNLINLGAVLKDKKEERDIYFTAPHRDFIKTKECLRIRERGDYLELTYKGPTTSKMLKRKQFWKPEINIPLENSKKEIKLLLELLNFNKVADFTKQRERFLLGKKTITIDKIEGLGYFLEIEEIVKNKKDRKRAIKDNIDLAKKLGLSEKDIIAEPRDLVIERNNRNKKISLNKA